MEEEVRAKLAELQRLQAHNAELSAKENALEAMLGASSSNMELLSKSVAGVHLSGSTPASNGGNAQAASSNSVVSSSTPTSPEVTTSSDVSSTGPGEVEDIIGRPAATARDKAVYNEQLANAVAAFKYSVSCLSPLLLELSNSSSDSAGMSSV